jgi:autotransporter-associated beta strand protein/T5SS/PEP-CTERM-associated repeat protein
MPLKSEPRSQNRPNTSERLSGILFSIEVVWSLTTKQTTQDLVMNDSIKKQQINAAPARSLLRTAGCFTFATLLSLAIAPASAQTVWQNVNQDWADSANWNNGVPDLNTENPIGFQVNNITGGNFPIIETNDYFFSAPDSNFFAVSFIGAGTSTTARLDIRSGGLFRDTAEGGYGNLGVAANGIGPVLNIANTAVTGQSNVSTFGQGSGSLTVREFLIGAFAGSSGTVNVNTTGSVRATQSIFVGSDGTGTLNLSGGSINTDNFAGGLIIGRNASATGTVNMDGGTIGTGSIDDQRFIRVGRSGTGTLNQSGGTINLANNMDIGELEDSTGTVNLSGGTTSVDIVRVGVDGSGTLNLSDNANMTVRNFNNGVRIGVNSDGSGTVNLNGGTLTTRLVAGGDGDSIFNFNGGTLVFTEFFAGAFQDLTEANILSGGAIIDTQGNNVGIAQDLQGVGDLTKRGGGTLTLSSTDNTFTGGLNVESGTLSIVSAFLDQAATVNISSGAVLNLNFAGDNVISGLIFNGTALENGTYTSSESFLTGTGTLTVIPEPSTLVLMGVALLAVLGLRRRK